MNDTTFPAKGYYSIVQYVPDRDRAEGANVGVVLFCPNKDFLNVRLAGGNDRIRRFFGKDVQLQLEEVNALKLAFEERVVFERSRMETPEDFLRFIESRANRFLLTPPRPIKVYNPSEDLTELFEALAGGRTRTQPKEKAEKKLRSRFEQEIDRRGLGYAVQRNLSFDVPVLKRHLRFPYGYRNEGSHVIQTKVFGSSEKKNVDDACVLAMEGRALLKLNVRLDVLASFGADAVDAVRDTLLETGVRLWTPDDMDALVHEIEAHSR